MLKLLVIFTSSLLFAISCTKNDKNEDVAANFTMSTTVSNLKALPVINTDVTTNENFKKLYYVSHDELDAQPILDGGSEQFSEFAKFDAVGPDKIKLTFLASLDSNSDPQDFNDFESMKNYLIGQSPSFKIGQEITCNRNTNSKGYLDCDYNGGKTAGGQINSFAAVYQVNEQKNFLVFMTGQDDKPNAKVQTYSQVFKVLDEIDASKINILPASTTP